MTVLGWVVGGIASIAIEKILGEILSPEILQQPRWNAFGRYISTCVFALIYGIDQALVVRQYTSGWLWMIATSLGWLVSTNVSTAWIDYISSIAASLNRTLTFQEAVIFGILSTTAYILSGIWLGLFQWLVLRRYASGAWWWNFLPSVSFLLISFVVGLLSFVQDFIPAPSRDRVVYLSGQGFTAIILGIIPAIGFCTLKTKHRIQIDEDD
ncbi:hypothetical protein F7734_18595 [Scytonema sp. UIC 10036]|uniref:hypothetical protein n=1 Tax=Scytonema sp. UIC 10036 TaxID=2304196 RepID=UPI0012DA73DD|nr:hypothetical protein [Scytonema sp. UIC 10036]MUG94281.1 hypothetical protein [Scytonema sp. UIC 10036]